MTGDPVPVEQARRHLPAIVARVERQHERVVLSRDGRPAAVLVSPDDLDAVEDTLDALGDAEGMDAIRRAEDELAAGEHVTAEELLKQLPPLGDWVAHRGRAG